MAAYKALHHGSSESTLSCFIYHRGIQEGTFAAIFLKHWGTRRGNSPPVPPSSPPHQCFRGLLYFCLYQSLLEVSVLYMRAECV